MSLASRGSSGADDGFVVGTVAKKDPSLTPGSGRGPWNEVCMFFLSMWAFSMNLKGLSTAFEQITATQLCYSTLHHCNRASMWHLKPTPWNRFFGKYILWMSPFHMFALSNPDWIGFLHFMLMCWCQPCIHALSLAKEPKAFHSVKSLNSSSISWISP